MNQYLFNIIPFRENSTFDFDSIDERISHISQISTIEKLHPFQIQVPVTYNPISTFKLTDNNGVETDLVADIAKLSVKNGATFKQVVFDGDTNLTTSISCGIYKLTVSDGTTTFVTEWFRIMPEADLHYLEFYNAADFDNFVYYDGWKNRMYFEQTPNKSTPFKEDKTINKNGFITYLFQIWKDVYEFRTLATKDSASAIERLQLYETINVNLLDFDAFEIEDRAEVEATVLENSKVFNVAVRYRTNKIEKSQCDTPPILNNWILITGFWRDEGIWIDTEVWIDSL
jgi:hypothetical protein